MGPVLVLVLVLVLSLCSQSLASSSITFQYRVREEQPTGTRVGRLLDDLRQRDEGGSLEDFQVVEQGKALLFSVDPRDGEVTTQARLDREELCRASDSCHVVFSVLYRRSGAVNCLRVRVEVLDLNDHTPTFPSPLQEVEISESAGIRMRIPLERAVDPDSGPNGLQTYFLSANQHFGLNVTTGPGGAKQAEIVVIKELDREVHESFDLTLVAYDKGNPPKSGSTLVRVHILDSNDNSPVFEDSSPSVTLREDTELGKTVIKLKATDPDKGANGEVEYSFSKHTHPDVQRLFHLDSQTGDISVRVPLDYEAQSSYQLIVQASDRGPNSVPSHCKLHIKLLDVNDNAPRIHMSWTPPNAAAATVLEGAPMETFLALVTVSDADSGPNGAVNVVISERSGPFRLKQIHGDIYIIVTDGLLDREAVMQYNITVLAQDEGTPSLSYVDHLLVSVLDENDNAPVFSSSFYKFSVKENNQVGDTALRVEAHDVDLDLSGRVSYHLSNSIEQETVRKFFSIHPKTGIISVQEPLDFEETNSYSFIVEAVDHGHPPLTSTASVQVDVEDVNDNHPVIKEPKLRKGVASLSIPVNAHKGEIVTELGNGIEEGPATTSPMNRSNQEGFLTSTIKADDQDSGLNARLQFLITDGNHVGLFWLDRDTGQLFVNTTNATQLIGQTFRVDIAVSDMGFPRLSTKATLEVNFINLKDHLKNSSPGDRGRLSFTMMMTICFGATCMLLLLAIALVTTFCRPVKREAHAYNCRQAESSYTRHPRRPQKTIRKSDIQLIPVIRGRKADPPLDDGEQRPLTAPPGASEDQQTLKRYNLPSPGAREVVPPHSKTLRKPANIELHRASPLTSTSSYRTLRQSRNSSSSSSSSHASKNNEGLNAETQASASQATLRRPKTSDGGGAHDQERRQILRDLVRLSMAAFGDSLELSSASPDVQQISQLLSLLHQGRLQPRTNYRGNKYSQRSGRFVCVDVPDWLSTKDSGHGESEAGDMDWEHGRDSPTHTHTHLEDGIIHTLLQPDQFFSDVSDPAWMARLSLPLTCDYHDNVFVPDVPPSSESELRPQDRHDSASSFSTFGKSQLKDRPVGGALLSDVSALFEMLLTQKADSQSGPRPDILSRLSAAYSQSLHCGSGQKRRGLASSSVLQ